MNARGSDAYSAARLLHVAVIILLLVLIGVDVADLLAA